jgi:hypothetical protein
LVESVENEDRKTKITIAKGASAKDQSN